MLDLPHALGHNVTRCGGFDELRILTPRHGNSRGPGRHWRLFAYDNSGEVLAFVLQRLGSGHIGGHLGTGRGNLHHAFPEQ
jgi:hypothetical protein